MGNARSAPAKQPEDAVTIGPPMPTLPPPAPGSRPFRTHVLLDKPVYKPGDTVYAVCFILDADTLQPRKKALTARARVRGPSGDVIGEWFGGENSSAAAVPGVLSIKWTVPDDQPGGDYVLEVHPADSDFAFPGIRKFNIRAFRPPRFNAQLDFAQRGYGPGDLVIAGYTVTRAEGGVPVGATATAVARIDGTEVFRAEYKVPESGPLCVQFTLPERMERGSGSLSVTTFDGAALETTTRTLPILLSVDATVFPEGGYFVYGCPCRAYVEAFTPFGEPADLAADVVDEQSGEVVGTVATAHDGRGVSTPLVLQRDRRYTVRVTRPSGVHGIQVAEELFRNEGATLTPVKPAFAADEPVALTVAGSPGTYTVRLYRSEKELASVTVQVSDSAPVPVSLDAGAAAGVLRVTVFNRSNQPVAERLVFRRAPRQLRITVTADKDSYAPGDTVTLKFTSTDETGAPVPAALSLMVTDRSVRDMVERRKLPPRLPAAAWLEAEVNRLEDTDKFFSSDPDADAAIDLLLGTQGWRRFAHSNKDAFVQKKGDAARKALLLRPEHIVSRQPVMPPPMFAFGGGLPGAPAMMRAMAAPMAMPAAAMVPVPEGVPLVQPEAAAVAELVEDGLGAVMEEMDNADDMLVAAAEVAADEPAVDLEEILEAKAIAPRMLAAPAPPPPPPQFGFPPQPQPAVPVQTFKAATGLGTRISFDRVFAHQRRPNFSHGERVDFAQTLLFRADLLTDATGTGSATFDLSDSVTTFAVFADGVRTDQGDENVTAVGTGSCEIVCSRPFYIESKLPLEVTARDAFRVPVGIVNSTAQPRQVKLAATVQGPLTIDTQLEACAVAENSRSRAMLPVTVADRASGQATVCVAATASAPDAGQLGDSVERSTQIEPFGFPQRIHFSGQLTADRPLQTSVKIADDLVPGSVQAHVVLTCEISGRLLDAVKSLVREPCGCFEQTSCSVYPMAMAQQYLKSKAGSGDTNPAIAATMAEIDKRLESGVKRLLSYDCRETRGFEWFGSDPGHEALTAYGLMEFTELRLVMGGRFDGQVVEAARSFLLRRRDGKGGFLRNSRALDAFGAAPQNVTDAYITWALTCADSENAGKDLAAEIEHVAGLCRDSSDPYLLALGANVMGNVGRKEEGLALLQRMKQSQDGSFCGAAASITRSGSTDLVTETTALYVMAALMCGEDDEKIDQAQEFIYSRCTGGSFGATQSTILSLKAALAYEQARATPKAEGSVRVLVDGHVVTSLGFSPESMGSLSTEDFGGQLSGAHEVKLQMLGGSRMQIALTVNYTAVKPDTHPDCAVQLAVQCTATQLREGETADVTVRLRNRRDEGVPMTVALIGLPGGVEARVDKLQQLVSSGVVSHYEMLGARLVVLYWRALAPAAEAVVTFDVVGVIPGRYTAPPSRAYLYYTAQERVWVDPISIEVLPA